MSKKSKPVVIKKLYLFILIAIISILLILGGYIFYSTEEKSIREEKHNEIAAIAELKVHQLTQWLNERIGDAQVATRATFLVQRLDLWLNNKNDISLKNEIIQRLLQVKDSYGYNDIFLCTTKGELLLASDNKKNIPDTIITSKVIEAVKNRKNEFTDFYFSPIKKVIHYDIIAPIISNKNIPIAALVLSINPQDYLYPLIQSWPTPSKTAETLLIEKNGDDVLFLNELRHQKESALKLRIPLTKTDVPAVQAVLGFKGVFEGKDYRGVDVLSFIINVPQTPWFMVSKVDKKEVYSELYFRTMFISFFTLVMILLFGATLAWFYFFRQKNIYKELFTKGKELWESQEEFRITLYSIGDGVITTDVKGIVKQMNPVAEQLTGWRESEAKGNPLEGIFKIVNEDNRDAVPNPVEKVLREGKVSGLANHTLLISIEGKEIPITDSGAPIKNQYGEITGVVLVFHDQTGERARQKAILKSEEEFRNFFENSPLGKSITGIDGSVKVNKSFCEMFGYSKDELITKKWEEITHKDDKEKSENVAKSLLEGKEKSIRFEKRYIHKNGNEVWAEVDITLQRDAQANPQYFITSVNNITERKRAEELLRESEEYYRSLFENMIEGFAYCKMLFENGMPQDFVYLKTNRTFGKLTGLKNVEGKKVSEVIPGILESDPGLIETYGRVSLTGKPEQFEVYLESLRDWYSISVYSPRKEYFVVVFDVVTKHKELEREKFRLLDIVEKSLNEIYVFDSTTLKFEYLNQGALNNIGYSLEEMKSLTPVDIKPMYTEETFNKAVEPLLNGSKEKLRFETIHRRKNGSDYPVEVHLQLHKFEDRSVFFAVINDVSERKRAEAVLQHHTFLMNEMGRIAKVGGWEFNPATGKGTWTDEVARIHDLDPEQPTDVEIGISFYKDESKEKIKSAIKEVTELGKPYDLVLEMISAKGNYKWIRTIGYPVFENDKIVMVRGSFQDITVLKKAEEEINKLNEELEQRVIERTAQLENINKELEAFSYSVSHDLRAPLRALDGFAKILLEDYSSSLDAEGSRLLNVITDNAKKMGSLIDDLLSFSRLSRQEIKFSQIDMYSMANSVFQGLIQDADKEKIEFRLKNLAPAFGDSSMIRQVWVNLIGNAIKFSSPKPKRIIEIGNLTDNDENVYYVKDNGVGFDMAYVNKLFGVFQRLHSAKDFEGTGVGLAIVQRIINRQNGRVWAEGKLNEGATFYFTIPFKGS